MAAIGISEFTFGYAFLYEQTRANWTNLRAAPVLPSLQQEKDEGWDAHMPLNGVDFYYQFKLSDHLSRRNAKFISDGTYTEPYYRLALHKKDNNNQHRRLYLHAHTNPHTYYVVPEFDTIDQFNAAFLARQIKDRSRLIPLAECDEIYDGEQHYITFQAGDPEWTQHSQGKRHEHSFSGQDLEKLYRGTENRWRSIDKPFADELFEKTRNVIKHVLEQEDRHARQIGLQLLDFNPRQVERREVLERTSQILSIVLGVTLVLVGTQK